jgi:hypothetical protein
MEARLRESREKQVKDHMAKFKEVTEKLQQVGSSTQVTILYKLYSS